MLEKLVGDSLKNGRAVRFRAPGRSMHPTIRHAEMVIVAPLTPAGLALGDIVLSRCGEKLTVHRFVRRTADPTEDADPSEPRRPMVVLRGDACRVCDPPIPESRILGKVVAIERRGRRVNPYGLHSEWVRRIYGLLARLISRLRSIRSTSATLR
jgi:hypothetical protein